MSWPSSTWVTEREDYRDPAFQQRVTALAAQRGGVVVCGVAQSGKTTLLHRLHEQNALGDGVPIISLGQNPERALDQIKQTTRSVLLDDGHHLLHWPSKCFQDFSALIRDRTFVLSLWPSFLRSGLSKEHAWLVDNHAFEMLPMLGPDETAAMVGRIKSDSPLQCHPDVASAIYRATFGHPVLVAELCNFLSNQGGDPLRVPTPADLRNLLDKVPSSTGVVQAIFDSLPRRMQRILEDASRDHRVRLDPLRLVGLANGTPACFSATLFERFWSSDRTLKSPTSSNPRMTRATPPALAPAISWIHLADLHFGALKDKHRFPQQAVVDAIVKDIRSLLWKPTFVLITGDVAFNGKPSEYRAAAKWLQEILKKTGLQVDALRMVPGNHDVDVTMSLKPNVFAAQQTIRQDPTKLDYHLQHLPSRKLLARRLSAYEEFVHSIAPNHPKTEDSVLDWSETVESAENKHGRIWMIGLCTVWVSDLNDTERKMVVGEQQLRLFNQVAHDDLLLVLTHHPPSWLHPRTEEVLLDRMAERAPHIHLCGHTYSGNLRAIRGIGSPCGAIRIASGAPHPDSPEPYMYAWGAIRYGDRGWELGWSPRVFRKGLGIVADRVHYDLEDDDFAWDLLPVSWKPPA